jgi:hypothetical protein
MPHVADRSFLHSPSNPVRRIAARSALVFVGLWLLSWANLFFSWPKPFEAAEPIPPVKALSRTIAVDLLHETAYHIPHAAILLTIILAVVGGLIWAKVDEKKGNNELIEDYARIANRYALAAGMIIYGLPMLFAVAVRQPDPVDWASLIAEFRAHDIMEFGIGYAPVYEAYTGALQVLAGALLLWRRTTKIGALMTVLALGNTAFMIAGFTHGGTRLEFGFVGLVGYFTLMALIILAPEGQRLLDFLVFARPAVKPASVSRPRPTLVSEQTTRIVKATAIALIVLPPLLRTYSMLQDARAKSPLYGAYRVERFVKNGQTVPLSIDAPSRWWIFAIGNYAHRVMIRSADGSRLDFAIGDTLSGSATSWRRDRARSTMANEGTLELRPQSVRDASGVLVASADSAPLPLRYRRSESGQLQLSGTFGADTILAELRRVPDDSFPMYNPKWR